MKQAIKQMLKQSLKRGMALRAGRRVIDFVAMARKSYLQGRVRDDLMRRVFSEERVLNGPFKGMIFPDRDAPKMLGSYEEELHEAVEIICARGYEQILDIGAAEGYYAVGFALRNPQAIVHAYEADETMLEACRRMAELNGVTGRLKLHGRCGPAELGAHDFAGEKTLVFCDCDSYERELMDPARVPGLKHADVLLETHDCMSPGITTLMRERFSTTHAITVYRERRKEAAGYPQLQGLTPFEQEVCLDEDRISADEPYVMEWFWMEAKAKFNH